VSDILCDYLTHLKLDGPDASTFHCYNVILTGISNQLLHWMQVIYSSIVGFITEQRGLGTLKMLH